MKFIHIKTASATHVFDPADFVIFSENPQKNFLWTGKHVLQSFIHTAAVTAVQICKILSTEIVLFID